MSRKARHLQVLDESQKEEFSLVKPSKVKSRLDTIKDARYDEAKIQANLYAMSLNPSMPPPNKLSYEKGGKKSKRRTRKNKTKKRYRVKNRK